MDRNDPEHQAAVVYDFEQHEPLVVVMALLVSHVGVVDVSLRGGSANMFLV